MISSVSRQRDVCGKSDSGYCAPSGSQARGATAWMYWRGGVDEGDLGEVALQVRADRPGHLGEAVEVRAVDEVGEQSLRAVVSCPGAREPRARVRW